VRQRVALLGEGYEDLPNRARDALSIGGEGGRDDVRSPSHVELDLPSGESLPPQDDLDREPDELSVVELLARRLVSVVDQGIDPVPSEEGGEPPAPAAPDPWGRGG